MSSQVSSLSHREKRPQFFHGMERTDCIDVKQLDITDTLNTNNYSRYISVTKKQDLLILYASPTTRSRSLFSLFGSPPHIWIYRGQVYPMDVDDHVIDVE